jgi:hypothetical protein
MENKGSNPRGWRNCRGKQIQKAHCLQKTVAMEQGFPDIAVISLYQIL